VGYHIIAITGDAPEKVAELVAQRGLTFTVLADADLAVTRQFGIVFKQGPWLLPVPAVFVVGTDGIIRFHYVHPDYTVRLDADVLLAAAKAGRK